jgi:hypothetical protein
VVGAVAGLLTAEVVLRLMSSLLEGGFLLRYGAMVAAVCFGGMLYGAIQMFVYGSLFSDSPNFYDPNPQVDIVPLKRSILHLAIRGMR